MLEPQESWSVIDSTKVNAFLECPRMYFYEYILGWRHEVPNIHLEFGKAWHLAMEHLIINGYSDTSVKDAFGKFYEHYRIHFPELTDEVYAPKNPANALRALVQYCQEYKDDKFTPLYTEIAGTVPIDYKRVLHFRMDSIVEEDGMIRSIEHKTGSSLNRQWTDQWSLAIQTGTYNHVLYCLYPKEKVWGVEINGVFFQKKENKFQRVPARRSLPMMNVWYWNMQIIFNMIDFETTMVQEVKEDDAVMTAFPQNPTSCTKYFGCAYHDYCMAWANPIARCQEVPMGFKQEWWNPMVDESSAKHIFHLGGEYNEGSV
jgi:hypothetical protein